MKTLFIVNDSFGAYTVEPDSLLAVAPKRKNGFWDRRTKLGKLAVEEFFRNQQLRAYNTQLLQMNVLMKRDKQS